MAFAPAGIDGGPPDVVDDLDRPAVFLEAEAAAGEDLLVNAGMKVRAAFGEVRGLPVDRDPAERPRAPRAAGGGNVLGTERKIPPDPGPAELQEAGRSVRLLQVNDIATGGRLPEDPRQDVERMDADVGRDSP